MKSERSLLYEKALKEQVITFNEIVEFYRLNNPSLSRKVIHQAHVGPLVEQKKLLRIYRGLYHALLPFQDNLDQNLNKFLVASKFHNGKEVICYHTALEYYGVAYNEFNDVYLGSESFFRPFTVGNAVFRSVALKHPSVGIVFRKATEKSQVKVTSKERTFIDSLDRVRYAGGWEEALKSLENLSGLDFDKLLEVLWLLEPKQILIRKVGFVLEILRNHPTYKSVYYEHLPDKVFRALEERLSNSWLYIDRSFQQEKTTSISRWKLLVSKDFIENNLRGV
ncbi:MAG: hypothetical protein EAX86_09400 [Candidatus Heimdallarchaeota archaeon]|nr:hypothetical protein [Candidatus Heimdallarchaeota archaeon]